MSKAKTSFYESHKTSVLILIGITLLVYFKSLFYQFSPMDEDWLIIRDQEFLMKWGSVMGAFNDAVQGLYYRPILIVTFIIDYHIGNLNPFIYHFTNVLIHILCVVVLYKLLLVLGTKKETSFFMSAIFAVHPMALQAVAWIPGRNDLLLCLFMLLSCFHLVKYISTGRKLNAGSHVLFFMLALFSKENSVFLVPVFAFIFFIYKTLDKKKLISFTCIWILQLLIWYFMMNRVVNTSLSMGSDTFASIKGFFVGFLIFIGKTLIPFKQSVSPNIYNSSIIAGIIVLALLGYAVFKFRFVNKKVAILGLVIYFILLSVPVWFGATSPLGEHLEHRAYSSMIGIIIFAGQLIPNENSKTVRNILALIILIFAAKTFFRIGIYKDGLSYITEAAADTPKNYFYQARKGNFLQDKGQLNDALNCYNTAIGLYNKKPQVYNDRANTYVTLGKKDEAIADYTKAFELGKSPQVLVYRCLAYKKFGDFENAFKDLTTLRQCCSELIPKGTEQEIVTGLMGSRLSELNKLIAAEPNNALLYVNRAKFYVDSRMGREALADLKKACELEPNNETYKGYYKELSSSFPH